MPINVNDPEYTKAEKEFHESSNPEDQLISLNKMISHAPSHKGAENLRQQLTTRRKKLESQIEKRKKSGKSSKVGIRKQEMQAVIIGKTNSGKSSLLEILTNAKPKIADYDFTTKKPAIGTLQISECNIQLIEIPAIESEYYDKGVAYNADTNLLITNSLGDLNEILEKINTLGKKIIVFNKIDKINEKEKRKLTATLKSKYKKYDFVLISCKNKEGIEELKSEIFQSFDKIRIYTREPGKDLNKKEDKPMILPPESTIEDVAEKIFKGFSNQIKETIITGPSSKFPNQKVGLKHKIKDLDIVEFKTK
jgi:uncharacterized protein